MSGAANPDPLASETAMEIRYAVTYDRISQKNYIRHGYLIEVEGAQVIISKAKKNKRDREDGEETFWRVMKMSPQWQPTKVEAIDYAVAKFTSLLTDPANEVRNAGWLIKAIRNIKSLYQTLPGRNP